MNNFFEQVYNIVNGIPYGKVVSYGQIARHLGRPRAAREVGWAMRACPGHLPWQRVVMADGTITGGAFAEIRRLELIAEGVDFLPDGRVDMDSCRWEIVPTVIIDGAKEYLEEMSEFFNNRSADYNTIHLEHVGGMETKLIIADFLPAHTETIIDFGIGTGLELEGIYKRFPNAKVVGIDIAEKMLRILKEAYADKNIVLHCESYLEYDFGVNHYDAAISVMTLHHYARDVKARIYRKIYNSLKPNGVYIESDYMLCEKVHENAQELEDFYFSEYARLKTAQGADNDKEYHYDTPCTVSNQIKLLREAGFTNVREVWRKGKDSAITIVAEKKV